MKKVLFILFIFCTLGACKSRKTRTAKKHKTTTVRKKRVVTKKHPKRPESNSSTNLIIKTAQSYKGTRYKYGGTSKSGMDCSGLIYTSFKKASIALPRTTKGLATEGQWIDLKKVKPGDLLFFATKKNNRTINHVGVVTYSHLGNVEFIHSTSSRGVIESSLSERYWYFAFVQARRIL